MAWAARSVTVIPYLSLYRDIGKVSLYKDSSQESLFVKQRSSVLLAAAIILLGLNLRPVIASVSPLVDQLQNTTALSNAVFASLTSIPVIIMGLVALWLGRGKTSLPLAKACGWAVAFIAVACGLRFYTASSLLFILTAIAGGIGIAVIQVLMPRVIKEQFANHISTMMGLYITAIMTGAALASVASPMLFEAAGVSLALSGWGLLAGLALLVWLLATRGSRLSASVGTGAPQFHATLSQTLRLCLLFGLGTGAYTLTLAWLPAFYQQFGLSPAQSGVLLGLLTVAEIVSGLAVTFVVGRLLTPQTALICAVALLVIGLSFLLAAPVAQAYPAMIVMGLGMGAVFPLSMIITLSYAASGHEAERLGGRVQGLGYILAAMFPYAAALTRSYVDDLTYAWFGMLLLCLPMLMLAISFWRDSRRVVQHALSR
jgi:CP family cyanate transporter-like MFS transporter